MGAIVYLSDFGPLSNPVFPLWWDIVTVAVFSLRHLLLGDGRRPAVRRIERMVDEVVPDEEEALGPPLAH